jgi:hypothetical protein
VTEPEQQAPPSRRTRLTAWLDRHATVLTIVCMAILVGAPTKIAYNASTNATQAGEKATAAARKATIAGQRTKHAVVRMEDERRDRIYDQNGIDHYFCGKTVALEKVLTLLVTAALGVHHPAAELTADQLHARTVFEEVREELAEAPECEVLIPPPPAPKVGETKEGAAEANRESQAALNPPYQPVPPRSHESQAAP